MKRLLLLCMPIVCCGCDKPSSNGSTVSGTVTVNGQLLAKGFISFFPESGTDAVAMAEIVDGRYRIDGLSPGKKRVLVTAAPEARIVISTTRQKRAIIDPSKSIRPSAEGNNQLVEISMETVILNLQISQRGS